MEIVLRKQERFYFVFSALFCKKNFFFFFLLQRLLRIVQTRSRTIGLSTWNRMMLVFSMIVFVLAPINVSFGLLGNAQEIIYLMLFMTYIGVYAFMIDEHDKPRTTSFLLDSTALLPFLNIVVLGKEVFRMIIFARYLKQLKDVSQGAVSRLGNLFLILILCAHVTACCWFGLGVFNEFKTAWGPQEHTYDWLTYGKAFHFALKSLTSGPEGTPETVLELFLSLAIMFLGFSVYATIIGSIGSVLLSLDTDYANWAQKFEGQRNCFCGVLL